QLTNVRVEVFRYDHAAQTPRMEAIKDSDSPYPLIYDSNFFPPNLNDMSLLGEVIIFKEAAAFCLAGGRLDPNAGPTIMMNDFIWTYSAGAFQREVFSAPTDLELIQRTYFSIRPANYTGSNPVLTLQYRNTRKTAVAPRIYAPPLFPMLASEYMDVVTTSYGYKDLPGISFKNVFMEVGDGINAPARKVVTNATDTTFFALPDVDVDSAILVYKNYQLMFSDPVVVAALAAPPYFTDLAAVDDRNNNYEESSTSFTVSSGSGTTATSSQTFEIGAYVAMDIAIGAGFAGTSVKAALEMEFEYNRGFTYESERTSTVVHDQKYTISAEDGDAVVLYCVPLDVYLYDLYVPKDIDGTIVYEPGNFYAVIPYKPVHNILSVADYDMVRQDHPDVLPDVKTEVFTHTVGDPATYPKSQIDGSQVFEQKSTYTSTGSMEQSIIITEDTSVGTATTNSYNFKAGGGVSVQSDFFDFEFKAGVTTGDSTSKGVMRTITNGTTYSASVMDKDNKNPRSGDYQFDWQLMCYMFKGTQNFPVITYLLTNVSSPARLPMDYGVLKTTSDSVKLYWEPGPEDDVLKGGAPLSNIEYKVYAVTNAAYGGDKIYRELTDTISYDGDEGIYTYCDGNLPAQTEFTYVITAAKRGVSGSVSTNSAEITAYTMRGGIYYDAQPQNIELTEKDSLTASLVAAAGYSREPITEWQKKSGIGNAWVTVSEPDYTTIKNIASATSLQSTLLFNDPSSAQAGIYRLVVKLEYGSIMWPIVSDPVTATYKAQNRVQSATTLGFDIQSGGAVNLSAEVAGSDGGAPTGVVQFKIESVSGNTPASYTGYAVAYLDGSGIAETTVLLSGTVVTHITATYSGDNRYAGSSDRTPVDIVPNRILRSIAAPNAITGVANGAAKSAAGLGLPSTVAMLTDAGYISANVAWDVASCSYNPDSPNPQSFAVTGAVTLPINVINPNDVSLTAAISVSVQPTSNAALLDILTGIEQPDSIVKDRGAVKTAAGLGLPATVTITTSRNPMGISADVTWNVEYCAYDPGIGAEQTFNVSGTVTLPAGVINLDDLSLTVYAEVTVLPSSPSSTTWTYNGGSGWTPDRDPTDPPVTEPGKTITINGVAVSYAIDNNGIVTLKPTEAQIKQIIEASKDGNISIDPGGLSGITVNGFILEANPVWFGAEKFKSLTLTVKGVGSVLIKSNVMANLSKQNKVMRFSLKKGSLVFDISTVSDGKSINYNDPVNPLYIIIPVTLAADTTANGYVGVRKTASGNVIMPYSVYKNGEIIFQTAGTGSFDVIYNGKTFTDTAGHWASPNIMFVAARNLFNGYGNGVFAPQDTMTRSMFAQVLANIESVDPSAYKTSRFTDVKVGAWYAPAVEWAASVGIVNGYGGGLFGPEDEINREQMAVMLMNYVEYKGYNLPTGSTSAFSDEPAIASWAYDAVKMVQAAGIVVGKPGNIYDPKCTATRAEVATICARFIEMMENGVV
ncbi:MAG: S-layer homology domain-containing protein, partial [Oscillospiraceae bacterium]|nr:S-layer homology domain-containing protein [Oscillospiraceae bacterium]